MSQLIVGYANIRPINNNRCYVDFGSDLYAVGDWLQMSDLETVWLNAEQAAIDFVAKM